MNKAVHHWKYQRFSLASGSEHKSREAKGNYMLGESGGSQHTPLALLSESQVQICLQSSGNKMRANTTTWEGLIAILSGFSRLLKISWIRTAQCFSNGSIIYNTSEWTKKEVPVLEDTSVHSGWWPDRKKCQPPLLLKHRGQGTPREDHRLGLYGGCSLACLVWETSVL